MIALLGALGFAALLILQPWEADQVGPRLSVAPKIGIGLGDLVAVAPGKQLAVAPARPVVAGTQTLVAEGDAVESEGAGRPQLAIAPARAVATPRPVAAPETSPGPPPSSEPSPAPQPSPTPVAVPVAAPTPSPAPAAVPAPPAGGVIGGHSPGPVGAGSGPIGSGGAEAIEVHDGDEYALAFSFLIQPTVYRASGDENLIVRFSDGGVEAPSFGLQLWDDGSGNQRGLWSSGDAMGGERFLAPLAEGVWHEAVLCFKASSEADGFYLLLLDGQPVDARAWVSLIDSGSSDAQVDVGLFRDGEPVAGTTDVLFGPTRLGDTLESVLP